MKKGNGRPARPRGRPRSFDREAALERAMELFWKQGYEATSLTDLTRAMGINPPSLYAAFGDKEKLFLEAIDLYVNCKLSAVSNVFDEPIATRAAIERLLTHSASELSKSGHDRGCMLSTSATNCSAETVAIALARKRAAAKARIKERIDRGIAEGDVAPGTDSTALAEFYATVLSGMSMQARDGATRKSLMATAEAAMRAWPEDRRTPAKGRRAAVTA